MLGDGEAGMCADSQGPSFVRDPFAHMSASAFFCEEIYAATKAHMLPLASCYTHINAS